MNPTPARIHVVFKTHLDLGFTNFARRVKAAYFQNFIPKAMSLARRLREDADGHRFIWTTGSWLVHEYLEQASPAQRRRLEQAIADGDLVWHGLPFTTHTELLDATLLRHALGLVRALDRRFGRVTIAAKMTDVPGHTRALVPLLAEAGIGFLHLGVNPASTPPAVPEVFRWRASSAEEITVAYAKGDYGGLTRVAGCPEALYFAHTGDNNGPPSADAVRQIFADLARRFPGARAVASTMDAYAAGLARVRDTLPVVTGELGDTWIHGAGTDPLKVARYRALLRWQATASPAAARDRAALRKFRNRLMLVPEHTWGMDIKHCLCRPGRYDEVWRTAEFQRRRRRPEYRRMEESWREQRRYLTQALAELRGTALRATALAALRDLRARRPARGAVFPAGERYRAGRFEIAFAPDTGAVSHLRHDGRGWATAARPLGLPWYEVFSAADYQRFWGKYIRHPNQVKEWAVPDFLKPGLECANVRHRRWQPRLRSLSLTVKQGRPCFWVEALFPTSAVTRYGCPELVQTEVTLDPDGNRLGFRVQWSRKAACRIPEAVWWSLTPVVRAEGHWRLRKLGDWIDPREVLRNGNRALHAVEQCAYADPTGALTVTNLDAPLVAPGRPALVDFCQRQPRVGEGLHFNWYNNTWGTNFPLWYEEDAVARFELALS
ncbi:MAG: DUF5054 domain-containing protein [Verrucomicrobiales bacterium]|jgi:hypothetical protein|nr:DUF5054 domain-containing protein [Verrucomicrobiales bacterium]